jgi:hypothetical protein
LAKKKETEDKLLIRQFRDGRLSWWLAMKHFQLLDGKLICASGGETTQEELDHMLKYLRNKKLL